MGPDFGDTPPVDIVIHQAIISSYQPVGNPPRFPLNKDSEPKQVDLWCREFDNWIKAEKVRSTFDIPYEVVLGHLAERVDPYFFRSILSIFLNENRPEEGSGDQRMSEDIIIDLVQQLYKMVNYINSTTYTQNHEKVSGKYGDS